MTKTQAEVLNKAIEMLSPHFSNGCIVFQDENDPPEMLEWGHYYAVKASVREINQWMDAPLEIEEGEPEEWEEDGESWDEAAEEGEDED